MTVLIIKPNNSAHFYPMERMMDKHDLQSLPQQLVQCTLTGATGTKMVALSWAFLKGCVRSDQSTTGCLKHLDIERSCHGAQPFLKKE